MLPHRRKAVAEAFTETPKKAKAEPRAKVNLNDRLLKSLRPGDRPFEVMDSQVRGFGIRIMPTGVKTFILRRRYPGSTQPARRSLGSYGEMSLAEAREKAAEWNALVKKGIDPGAEEARQRKATVEAERNRKLNTFGSAFDNYLRRKASKLRSFRTIERELRRECAAWMDKPLSSISPIDVNSSFRTLPKAVEKPKPRLFLADSERS
jgi:hypothetical protein